MHLYVKYVWRDFFIKFNDFPDVCYYFQFVLN